ncbi:hypothetical protein [Sphingobium xenophagum]|uniref:hypothetical protein n=1 Tax=Sphingobium xenophagum TaxID=121428 RepID=UPI0013EE9A24|nr:hypothetical protein [Sphingobium xenophagum]
MVDTCPETRESEIQPLSVRQGSISPWTNAASWDKDAVRCASRERQLNNQNLIFKRHGKHGLGYAMTGQKLTVRF